MLPLSLSARKTGYKLKSGNEPAEQVEMARGSFMVASQCLDCNNGYKISQVGFYGYDKPQSSANETFMISNGTDRTMTGIALYIDYTDTEGSQITKKYVKLSCRIPPGETRIAEIKSWDTQKSYYYINSQPSRHSGTPYKVTFDPVSFWLQY